MRRRPRVSTRTDTLFPYNDALPISPVRRRKRPGDGRHGGLRGLCPDANHKPHGAGAGGRGVGWRVCTLRSWSAQWRRSEEHTSELQSLMRISYAVFCWNKKTAGSHITHKQEKLLSYY